MMLRDGQGLVPGAPRGSLEQGSSFGVSIWGQGIERYPCGCKQFSFTEELGFGVSQGEFGQARGQCAQEWVKQRLVWATDYSLGDSRK